MSDIWPQTVEEYTQLLIEKIDAFQYRRDAEMRSVALRPMQTTSALFLIVTVGSSFVIVRL